LNDFVLGDSHGIGASQRSIINLAFLQHVGTISEVTGSIDRFVKALISIVKERNRLTISSSSAARDQSRFVKFMQASGDMLTVVFDRVFVID